MNYQKIYDQLIAKRLSQPIGKTVADKEEHHIIPKSFGGTETVYLTVREHIFAHELLVLIYKDSDYCKFRKMLSALNVIYNKNSQQLRKVKTHSKPLASIIVKYRIQKYEEAVKLRDEYNRNGFEGCVKNLGYGFSFKSLRHMFNRNNLEYMTRQQLFEKNLKIWLDVYNEYGYDYLVKNTGCKIQSHRLYKLWRNRGYQFQIRIDKQYETYPRLFNIFNKFGWDRLAEELKTENNRKFRLYWGNIFRKFFRAELESKKLQTHKDYVSKLNMLAQFYNKYGYDKMVEKFDYRSSENTFRCMCNKYKIYHKNPLYN